MEFLLQKGCSPNAKVERYRTDCSAFVLALKKSSNLKLLELLLEYGADVNGKKGKDTVMVLAGKRKDVGILKLVLKYLPSKQNKLAGNYYFLLLQLLPFILTLQPFDWE